MKKYIIIALLILLSSCSNDGNNKKTELLEKKQEKEVKLNDLKIRENSQIHKNTNFIKIQYRDSLVNLNKFEFLDTSKSSFVKNAWYDSKNQYMIIKFGYKYYHYCNLSKNIWNSFKNTYSFGTYYKRNIKNNFSCIGKNIPIYTN